MNDADRKLKQVRLVLQHTTEEDTIVYWIQRQDDSYTCILKQEGAKSETSHFDSTDAFLGYVYNFLRLLATDDDPQHCLQIDAKGTPSILVRVHKLKNDSSRVYHFLKRFFD